MKKTILVVDDETSIVKTLKILLEMEGYIVVTACNGKEGYERAAEYSPDLIIMDFKMPVMDGWEATKLIREKLPTCKSIPILGNTGYASEENVIHGLENGLTEIVKKPFNVEKLQNLVRHYLEG